MALLAITTLWVYRLALFGEAGQVLSIQGGDLAQEYLAWRKFGFEQLRHGHLPLWNPYLFSGSPFFGNPETALLYPPNWFLMWLPLPVALNAYLLLHIFLAGATMYAWLSSQTHRFASRVVASICFMLSGPVATHVWPGHLSNLAAMGWAPLLFLAIDCWRLKTGASRSALKWIVIGAGAIALQILAGHLQYVYYTGLVAGAYALWRAVADREGLRPLLGLGAMYGAAISVTAVQLFTTVNEAAEGVRAGPMPWFEASTFSFPPENVLTFLVPGFFGSISGHIYWGRGYIWEMCAFMGSVAFFVALLGLVHAPKKERRLLITMTVGLLIVAMGHYTPLQYWLYQALPGFNRFRGLSKFLFFVSLYLSVAIAFGADRLLESPKSRTTLGLWAVAAALGLATFAGIVEIISTRGFAWESLLVKLFSTGEVRIPIFNHQEWSTLLKSSAAFAVTQTFIAAAYLGAAAIALLASRRFSWVLVGVALIGWCETVNFAGQSRETFGTQNNEERTVQLYLDNHPGEYRVLDDKLSNSLMMIGKSTAWGYSATLSARYRDFMKRVLGNFQMLPIRPDVFHGKGKHYLQIIRTRYALERNAQGGLGMIKASDSLPRFSLLRKWEVIPDRARLLDRIASHDFNPFETVLLESPPDVAPPAQGDSPAIQVSDETTDAMTVSVNLQKPAILLITDAFALGWRAVPLPGSTQSRFSVLPADGAVRAIPLEAGSIRFRLEYLPKGFVIGKWVSIASLLLLFAFAVQEWSSAVLPALSRRHNLRVSGALRASRPQ